MKQLAERIGTGPKLVPDDMVKRARVFGLIALVAAEDGLIWNSRIQTTPKGGQKYGKLAGKYGYTPETTKLAPKKMIDIITLLCNWLEAQQKAGSKYLVGNSLTAADIYVATMSYMFKAPGPEMMPRNTRTKYIEMGFGNLLPEVEAAIRPIFLNIEIILLKHIVNILLTPVEIQLNKKNICTYIKWKRGCERCLCVCVCVWC